MHRLCFPAYLDVAEVGEVELFPAAAQGVVGVAADQNAVLRVRFVE